MAERLEFRQAQDSEQEYERQEPIQAQESEQEYTFTNVELFKNETLGTGSYGAVCKAKCDQLICAAKLLYPVLFQMTTPDPGKEHRQPIRRFEEECRFLSRINHPNIVQYMGTYHDPETNAPVLLMELMDESLTHFLENSTEDIPYHIQVNLCSDIAQALAFLHANGIIHRDLSSNNVLLIAGSRAKVTDFGMSKFTNLNMTPLATMTTCPGTPVYMSPEALDEPPVYTEKLDNFSFGVLLVQTITQQFPKPTDRFEVLPISDPQNPLRTIGAKLSISEVKRRQAHISLIEPSHPLLPLALHCLEDREVERPSSEQLCQTLDDLKRTVRYEESSQQDVGQLLRDKDEQIKAKDGLLNIKDESIQRLLLRDKNRRLLLTIQDNETLKQDKHALQHQAEARERQLRRLNQQLESYEETTARLQQAIRQRDREVSELRRTLASKNKEIQDLSARFHQAVIHEGKPRQLQATPTNERPVTMVWESLPDAPVGMEAGSSAVIGDKAYFRPANSQIVYEFSNNQWKALPKHPIKAFTIVSVDNILTTVGGHSTGICTAHTSKKLYSYVNHHWVKRIPPMPTKRQIPAAVYANYTLVVAGGYNRRYLITKVEILNTQVKQWSSVSLLPVAVSQPSAVICGDCVYIHPRVSSGAEKCSVFKCSLSQLTWSKPSSALWIKIASLPVHCSSLVAVNGRLLAVSGRDSRNKQHMKNIYQYNSTTNLWIVVSQMPTSQSECLTALLPGNKLMVVGGYSNSRKLRKIKVAKINS